MNVIPFRPRPQPQAEPLAFAIGARVDLRVGAIASGVVRAIGEPEDAFAYSNLARLVRGARMAWLERGAQATLTLAVPASIQNVLEADMLSEAVIEAGCTRRTLNFQLNERELVAAGVALAENLRARGWNIALRGDPDCPLPFGARARNLYSELVVQAPAIPDPFLAMDDGDRSPLGRRLLAAKAAGLVITAETVLTASQARMLAIAGFDRGGGAFAEAGLR
ncbi:MAG: hypothetical protein JNL81_15840 [Hyphomonadaceae bacterium]|nr:hypothetical protein [Hyphomonadaceae bacterium]